MDNKDYYILLDYLKSSGMDKRIISLIHKKRIALGETKLLEVDNSYSQSYGHSYNCYWKYSYQVFSKVVYTIFDPNIGFDEVLAETSSSFYDLGNSFYNYKKNDVIYDVSISKEEFINFIIINQRFRSVILDYLDYYKKFEFSGNNEDDARLVFDIEKIDREIDILAERLEELNRIKEEKMKYLKKLK